MCDVIKKLLFTVCFILSLLMLPFSARASEAHKKPQMGEPPITISCFFPPKDLIPYNGTIIVAAYIGKDGNVYKTKIIRSSGNKSYDTITELSARRWRFKPALDENGKPMECVKMISFPFNGIKKHKETSKSDKIIFEEKKEEYRKERSPILLNVKDNVLSDFLIEKIINEDLSVDFKVVDFVLYIDSAGSVLHVDIVKSSGNEISDYLLKNTLMRWKFNPALDENGKPGFCRAIFSLVFIKK
ncbi:TonB family protein [Dialister micraerophilus]|uniref:TonB family protein n=1 Tax=Dialister micraerophilus TaxID=309120 RepID=UPI0023F1D320|nr:TonB family protein [Dialister micraerophilus]